MTERQKMLIGDLYDPLDAELTSARERARDLCQALNATREAEQEVRRRILSELFGKGGETVIMQPPLWACWTALFLFSAACLALLSWKVKAYEVVK